MVCMRIITININIIIVIIIIIIIIGTITINRYVVLYESLWPPMHPSFVHSQLISFVPLLLAQSFRSPVWGFLHPALLRHSASSAAGEAAPRLCTASAGWDSVRAHPNHPKRKGSQRCEHLLRNPTKLM